jgi:hypothetical protein
MNSPSVVQTITHQELEYRQLHNISIPCPHPGLMPLNTQIVDVVYFDENHNACPEGNDAKHMRVTLAISWVAIPQQQIVGAQFAPPGFGGIK